MFKETVVLGAVLFTLLCPITACSHVTPHSTVGLSHSTTRTIAQELANVSSSFFPDRSKSIHLRVVSDQKWLEDALVEEFTAKQHLLADTTLADHSLTIVATELSADFLQVSLTIDGNRSVQRLFRFEPIVAHKDRITPSETDFERLKTAFVSIPSETRQSDSTTSQTLERESVLTPDSGSRSNTATSPLAAATFSTECSTAILQKGSLKRNLVRILQACGWRLVSWPADPKRSNHELDWLVPDTQTLAFESLGDLVKALQLAFDLEIELDHSSKTVRIQSRG